MKHVISLAFAGLLLGATTAVAAVAPTPGDTLAEAWVDWQEQRTSPLDWGYSFALRQSDASAYQRQEAALLARLDALRGAFPGASAWHDSLRRLAGSGLARSPERLDLPHLAADLRRNPRLTSLVHMGTCPPPDWIEVWSQQGVSRLDWQPGLTSDGLLAQLPRDTRRGVDVMHVTAPTGQVTRLGIAAWNHQRLPLAPGARLVLLNPRHVEDRQATEALLAELADYLATRLPGDACELKGFY
ncbi:hypothetical protein [Halomonas sp. 328]|uniref:hypothetical protein n=1 Tax=Halomonas sp. 328 TaxID=2776704 RepID=UPI0018A6EC03|nr:hypothetical protein [Halomonas sp. 328]MBF8223917.1 hypothetical protein [Halomonas sp. 328]